MAHHVRLKPAPYGGWLPEERPSAAQWTLLDQQLRGAVNGDAGGSWVPASTIRIGGRGLSFPTYGGYAHNAPLSITRCMSAFCGDGSRIMPQLSRVENSITVSDVYWTGSEPSKNGILSVEVTTQGSTASTLGRFKWSSGFGDYTTGVTIAPTVTLPNGTVLNFDTVHTYLVGEAWYAECVRGFSLENVGGLPAILGRRKLSEYRIALDQLLHDGATLTNIRLHFAVTSAHANVPGSLPTLAVQRVSSSGIRENLFVGTAAIAAPGSGATWYASGAIQHVDRACTAHNVIDRGAYSYELVFIEEGGANSFSDIAIPPAENFNSAAGTALFSVVATMTTIADARFGLSHFVYLDGVDGVWADGEAIPCATWNLLDAQLFAAVDGDTGGAWCGSSPIIIGGSGVEVVDPPAFVRPVLRSVFVRVGGHYLADTLQWQWMPLSAGLAGGGVQGRIHGATYDVPLTKSVHHGATLSNVRLLFAVGESHAFVPAEMPSLAVSRSANGVTEEFLHTSAAGSMAKPASGAAWYAGGAQKAFDLACTINNVIDAGAYRYRVRFNDEGGTGSFVTPVTGNGGSGGTILLGLRLDFTNILSMAFP